MAADQNGFGHECNSISICNEFDLPGGMNNIVLTKDQIKIKSSVKETIEKENKLGLC